MTTDTSCSIHPYFKIAPGQRDAFKAVCARFVERTQSEPGCLFYGFSFDGDLAHCRESYRNAQALLAHLANVDDIIAEALKISTLARVEVHGPADQLAALRGPLADLNPQFFTLELGFRK
ncbi:MAG TPA: antibiotic biosynthesis monooxygenase [Verrucomicrobiae bacterium]|nr:antibiotic biosynthesis monooxygenase [Verrucomicrobiae bacterium]